MTFFVDANVILYAATASTYHDACEEILTAVARGQADGRTSTAVLEEVWHVERRGRIAGLGGLAERAYRIFTPLLSVTDEAFQEALAVDAPRLETNDRIHVGTCISHGIMSLVTTDTGFEGVRGIRRVEPLDDRSRRRLLASNGG